jgi:hypothetical protein
VAVHAIGERHIRGLLSTPAPPGALLDSGLQLLSYWLHATQADRVVSYPVSLGSISYFAPPPAVGDPVECVGRLETVTEREAEGGIQFVCRGQVWAQVAGCVSRRFGGHARLRAAEMAPEQHPFAARQPEGWVAIFAHWADPASQNAFAHITLGAHGYQEYERQPVAGRRGWLLRRVAVKDAVRFLLWDRGDKDVFPIEIKVSDGADGRPRIEGWPGRAIPPLDVSVAQVGDVAVAVAQPTRSGRAPDCPRAGIGIAEISDHRAGPPEAVFSVRELDLLENVAAGSGRDVWLSRFQAAKEAALRAGWPTGVSQVRPEVTGATSVAIDVMIGGHIHRITHREISNPEGLPAQRYTVAWTTTPASNPVTRASTPEEGIT